MKQLLLAGVSTVCMRHHERGAMREYIASALHEGRTVMPAAMVWLRYYPS